METQKIINLLNDSSNEESKFATKYSILQTVKQQKINTTKTILSNLKQSTKSSLCDYSDAFILVTGGITVNAGNNTDVAFKNCALLNCA